MKHLSDLSLSFVGMITSLLTALLLLILEYYLNFPLYSLTVLFVIPIGAIAGGAGAASGYYFAARIFNNRPSNWYFIHVIFISAFSFFAIYYAKYTILSANETTPFLEFLEAYLEDTELTIGGRGRQMPTGRVGKFGIFFGIIQVIGFSIGGLFVFIYLKNQPYCLSCNAYYRTVIESTRNLSKSQTFISFKELLPLIENDSIEKAINYHKSIGVVKHCSYDYPIESRIVVKECECYSNYWIQHKGLEYNGKNYVEIDDLRVEKTMQLKQKLKV